MTSVRWWARIASWYFVAWSVMALWFGSNTGLTVIGLPTIGYAEQSIARGRAHDEPVRVGFFTARETEVLPNGVVRIITITCVFDDCGVAFSRGAKPPVIGEDSYWRLSGTWWRWRRSW